MRSPMKQLYEAVVGIPSVVIEEWPTGTLTAGADPVELTAGNAWVLGTAGEMIAAADHLERRRLVGIHVGDGGTTAAGLDGLVVILSGTTIIARVQVSIETATNALYIPLPTSVDLPVAAAVNAKFACQTGAKKITLKLVTETGFR